MKTYKISKLNPFFLTFILILIFTFSPFISSQAQGQESIRTNGFTLNLFCCSIQPALQDSYENSEKKANIMKNYGFNIGYQFSKTSVITLELEKDRISHTLNQSDAFNPSTEENFLNYNLEYKRFKVNTFYYKIGLRQNNIKIEDESIYHTKNSLIDDQ